MKERVKTKVKGVALMLAGVAVGALNGLLGGGGGMVTVPALRYLGGLPTKKAHATAIGVMLPLSLISVVTYTLGGVYAVRAGALSAVGVFLGGLVGASLLSRLAVGVVAVLFYALMIAAGVWGVVKWLG